MLIHSRKYEECTRPLKIYSFYGTYCAMACADLQVFGHRKFFDLLLHSCQACTLDPLTGVSYLYVEVVPGKVIVSGF